MREPGSKLGDILVERGAASAEQVAEALTAELGKQYSSYEAAPGAFINGEFTMGENIGDMSGLQVAYDAYKMSLGGREAPVIDGLSGDQRFFLGWGQVWRTLFRTEALRQQLVSDPHSPGQIRAINPLRNVDAWYKAFDVKPGDAQYLAPANRVRIW